MKRIQSRLWGQSVAVFKNFKCVVMIYSFSLYQADLPAKYLLKTLAGRPLGCDLNPGTAQILPDLLEGSWFVFFTTRVFSK